MLPVLPVEKCFPASLGPDGPGPPKFSIVVAPSSPCHLGFALPTVPVYKTKGAIDPLQPPPPRTRARNRLLIRFSFGADVASSLFIRRLMFMFGFDSSASFWFSIPFELLGKMKGVVAMRKEIRVPEASIGRRCRFHKSSKKF
jgi:hypothetical protein